MLKAMKVLGLVCAMASMVAMGCATTAATTAKDDSPGVLIMATLDYELHYRGGDVLVVRPRSDAPATSAAEEKVRTYREFKKLYELRKGGNLPATMPADGVTLTGWGGLDCVRPGHTCGVRPDLPPAEAAVKVKVRFGR